MESEEKTTDTMLIMGAVVAVVTACGVVAAVLLFIAGLIAL